MAEYVLTPESQTQPLGTRLMEELHRRGFPVEINLKGTDEGWESIRFYEAGPPELECQLAYDEEAGRYKISVSRDASPQAHDLQLILVDSLLQTLGGQVDNTSTLERFTPAQFAAKLKAPHSPMGKTKDWIWIGFSWSVVVAGFIALFAGSGQSRMMVGLVLAFASLSAIGLTYSHFKNG
jgi:hypothetical protein